MSLDTLLRDYARQDLQRFCAANHYLHRDHNPIADRELTEPLLREPVRFGLTPRERIAATALGDLTTYTIRSRAIWDAAHPVRDSDDPTPTTGTTFDEEREIWGRRECFRADALVYARMLGDTTLIEHYQTPWTAPVQGSADTTAEVVSQAAPANKQARTWRAIAQPYMVEKLKAGKFSNVKDFNRALIDACASDEDSPFEVGTGATNRGLLVLRKTGKKLELQTIRNAWPKLRAAAGLA